MNTPLQLLDQPPESMDDWQPGMMWPLELHDDEGAGYTVVLCRYTDSGGVDWPIVWHTKQVADGGPRWDVTGEPPKITVTPSINVIGIWHGFITNGELVPC